MNTLTRAQAQSILDILSDVPLRNLLDHPQLISAVAVLEHLAAAPRHRGYRMIGDPINRDVTYDIYLKIVPTLGKVAAIKAIRTCTDWDLKKAKHFYEIDVLCAVTPDTEYVMVGPFLRGMHWSGVDNLIEKIDCNALVLAIDHIADPEFPYVVVLQDK